MPYGRRSRFRHYGAKKSKINLPVILAICVGSAVILALVIGNLLRHTVDDETYRKLTEGAPMAEQTEMPDPLAAPAIRAYGFLLGTSTSRLPNDPLTGESAESLSIPMNTPGGAMRYSSDVADYLGLSSSGSSLQRTMDTLRNDYGIYLSGVFYSHATEGKTGDLRYAKTAEEVALLREFLNAGGSEIVLMDLPMADSDELTFTLAALRQFRAALPDARMGVAVPLSVATGEIGWEVMGLLSQTGCFLLLDVRPESLPVAPTGTDPDAPTVLTPEQILSRADYFLQQYEMRLLFSTDQTELKTAVESALRTYQILLPPPAEESSAG